MLLALWDEKRRKLVDFRQARKDHRQAEDEGGETPGGSGGGGKGTSDGRGGSA
jgi:hypothetical protein